MIAPTFDMGNDSIWFAVATMALWLSLAADDLVTRLGIWYHSQTEGNPLYKKFLPLSVYKFLFNGAAGAFADGAFRFVLAISLLVVCRHFGFANNSHSYLPFALAGGVTALVVRNWLTIRKFPTSKVIGQVS
jgi:hypothetical protein